MTSSSDRKSHASKTYSAALDFASVIIVALIGCTTAALTQRPLNAAVEIQGQTSFVCSSDIDVPQWLYSPDGKSNQDKHKVVKLDYCSVYPEDAFHFQTEMTDSNKTCTLTVRYATKELAGVYTCIDGSSKNDQFSALLTVIDPHPGITVNNESTVIDGQTLSIACEASYAAPLSPPAPPFTPSIYFSTSDGQRVSNASVVVTTDSVKASFSIAAAVPFVPSFTCVVFFPTLNETNEQYASNTPTISYTWSSPVINVSRRDDELKTDVPLSTTTTVACESGSCDDNRQNVNTSTDDVGNNDWRSIRGENRSIDNTTGGDNNDSAALTTLATVGVTTTIDPTNLSINGSGNATDNDTYIVDDNDDGTTEYYANETRSTNGTGVDVVSDFEDESGREEGYANKTRPIAFNETDFSDLNNMTSDPKPFYNSTDINDENINNVSEATTYYQDDLHTRNDANSNSTDIVAGGNETTNYTNGTAADYEDDFSSWRNTTGTADDTSDGSNVTNIDDTDFSDFNETISSDNSTDVVGDGESTSNNTTTMDEFNVGQDFNTTTNQTTELTNTTKDGAKPTTPNIFNIDKFSVDKFLNSTFPFNALKDLFPNFFKNDAPRISKASFSSLVAALLTIVFLMN